MLKSRNVKIFAVTMFLILTWFCWPVYEFAVELGKAPPLPIGFVDIPEQHPVSERLHSADYQYAGERAVQLLIARKQLIHAPAISAAVAIDGEVVWAAAVGWADIARATPATPATQFRIGSTSKALTATALARLVEAGQIGLDVPIGQYANRLPNSQWRELTARQLASHMAGLPDYRDNRDWAGFYHTLSLNRRFENATDALEIFDGSPRLYQPGEDFKYTTFGTVLLSAMMEQMANKPYAVVISDLVFAPLGLSSTAAEPDRVNENMATFYWHEQDFGPRVKPWRKVDLSHRLAGGGFVSTSTDLVKLGSAWLDEDFISSATREVFWTPQRLNNGDVNPQNYALGWRLHEGDEHIPRNVNHGGISRGAQSWLMVFPERRMAVAVNINTRTREFWDFGSVAVDIANEFADVGEARE